jgi:hypothetical protein
MLKGLPEGCKGLYTGSTLQANGQSLRVELRCYPRACLSAAAAVVVVSAAGNGQRSSSSSSSSSGLYKLDRDSATSAAARVLL